MIDASLFVSDTIHEREVAVGKGKIVKLHFKELPAIDFVRFHSALQGKNDDARAGAAATLIAASLCEPDGAPALTLERAMQLKTVPMNAIFNAVLEVNSGDEKNA